MFFISDNRNFGWSGAVSRGSAPPSYSKPEKQKGRNSNGIKSSFNNFTHNDFMSKIIKNSDDGKSSIIIPTTKLGSINVDNYIANII